jgi:hypothetical protein
MVSHVLQQWNEPFLVEVRARGCHPAQRHEQDRWQRDLGGARAFQRLESLGVSARKDTGETVPEPGFCSLWMRLENGL